MDDDELVTGRGYISIHYCNFRYHYNKCYKNIVYFRRVYFNKEMIATIC